MSYETVKLTRVWHEDFVDEVDDSIAGDDVLLKHHLDAVDCETVSITADLDVAPLQGLVWGTGHYCLGTLNRVQQMVVEESCGWEETSIAVMRAHLLFLLHSFGKIVENLLVCFWWGGNITWGKIMGRSLSHNLETVRLSPYISLIWFIYWDNLSLHFQ